MKCYNCNNTNFNNTDECATCHFPTVDSAQLRIRAQEELAAVKKSVAELEVFNNTVHEEVISTRSGDLFDRRSRAFHFSKDEVLELA